MTRALFSHLATIDGLFFTGVAILNSQSLPTHIRVVALRSDGTRLGRSFDTVLLPRQRISCVITDMIPEAANQGGGLIWIKSEYPIHLTSIFGTTNASVYANVPPQPVPASYNPDQGLPSIRVTPPRSVLQPLAQQKFQLTGGQGTISWGVDSGADECTPGTFQAGNDSTGTIDSGGTYHAPGATADPLPISVSGGRSGGVASEGIDVLSPSVFLEKLGTVQSVAYLEGLQKLYTSELLAGGEAATLGLHPRTGETSEIFEVDGGSRTKIGEFPGENIPKILPFRAVDDREYLLLAGMNGGRIIRLDPQTSEAVDVRTGLKQPASLVFDPVTGNLLVAEADGISSIPVNLLQSDLFGLGTQAEIEIQTSTLVETAGAAGLAVDACSGDIYFSDPQANRIQRLIRARGQVETVLNGIAGPGQMTSFYRRGVSCPLSFELLTAETGADRIFQTSPALPFQGPWVPSPGVRDVIFIERDRFSSRDQRGGLADTAMLAENLDGTVAADAVLTQANGRLSAVPLPDLYRDDPTNPPLLGSCVGNVTFDDQHLATAVREALALGRADLISCESAQSLRTLDARRRQIENLDGIDLLSNLEKLFLGTNQIVDLSPLAALGSLVELDLSANRVIDVLPLAGLPLSILDLTDNQIRDLTPLAAVRTLTELGLTRNQVANIDSLANLTSLLVLFLDSNQITDLTALSNLAGLTTLELGMNQIEEIAPLKALVRLTSLGLATNQIGDISALQPLTRLSTLFLSANQITDVEVLRSLLNLRDLRLTSNRIQDLSPLTPLTRLSTLFLALNPITDIGALVENEGLEEGDVIDLRGTGLNTNHCPDLDALIARGATVMHDVNCP